MTELLRCTVCEEVRLCERHHTIPKCIGGEDTIPLCVDCHNTADRTNISNWDQEKAYAGFREAFEKCGPAGRLFLLKTLKVAALALANAPGNHRPKVPRAKGVRHGERHHNSKLTEAQVLEIRGRRAIGETCRTIAESLQISKATVLSVARRQSWKHIA